MNTQPQKLVYAIPQSLEGEDPIAVLEARLRSAKDGPAKRVQTEQDPRRRVTYFDTFDCRLHRAGGCLSLAPARTGTAVRSPASGVTLSWLNFDGTPRHRLAAKSVPPFAGDFPAGSFRQEIEKVIAMRRLLAVVELRLSGCTLRMLDAREKTLVRLRFEQGTARVPGQSGDPEPLADTLTVLPVRGYAKAYRRVIEVLETELGLEQVAGSELDRALAAIGRQARDYVPKVVLELDPAMPAAEAAKTIHRSLLATIRRNEHGTRRDLDSEFLHDYRVAVRRTRSALSQIKKVYPGNDLAHFKVELKWLGGLTGHLRDLDVYLLKMDDYKADLPPEVRDDLAPLGDYLRDRQRRESRRVARQMGIKRYRTLLEAWDLFLSQPADLDAAANAGRPIAEVASERIWKIYRRVIKKGLAIDDDTPAEAVHDLRIECKKLRYLMEFFRSLYDAKRLTRLIKALKLLQDNLGDFNDYEVQQGSLREFAADMIDQQAAPADTVMAMGRLVEHLEKGQARERHQFGQRFARFAQEQNQSLARDLFGPRPKEVEPDDSTSLVQPILA